MEYKIVTKKKHINPNSNIPKWIVVLHNSLIVTHKKKRWKKKEIAAAQTLSLISCAALFHTETMKAIISSS